MDTEELQQVFRDYRRALRSYSYLLDRFKAPLSRVEALCKQRTRLSLLHRQQLQQDQLSSLLPPGLHTHFLVNIYHLLTLQSLPYHLHIPTTLFVHNSAVWLLQTKSDGSVSCEAQTDLSAGLRSLSAHLRPACCQVVLKCSTAPPTFLSALPAALPSACLLQTYIPGSTLVRAHWKRGRTAYYIIHPQSPLPGFHISARRTDCTFVKRLKPFPQVDNSLSEVRKLLEHTVSKGKVQEMVCDYVLDSSRAPVLLNCDGYRAGTTLRILTRTISAKVNVLESHSECREQAEETLEQEKGDTRPSTEVPQSRPRVKRVPALAPSPESLYLSALLSKEVSHYDQIKQRIQAYRQEQLDSIDFVQKYGGTAFWRPILERVAAEFRADHTLKQHYDHLNFEEGHMLLRGYQRILEGHFSIYYKKSMTLIHAGKGISATAFQAFVSNVAKVLRECALSKQDCEVIVDRFRSMESCICPS